MTRKKEDELMGALIFVLLLLIPSFAWGSCMGASPTWTTTPDLASVNTCVSSAVSGDTVNVTGGTASWTSYVLISGKSITLKGVGAGTDVQCAVPGQTSFTCITADPTNPTVGLIGW